MPHTNRKKKYTDETRPKPRVPTIKRQELEDDDGWTHIVGPSKASKKAIEATHNHDAQNVASDFTIENHGYVNRTVEEMKSDHEKVKKRWEESEDFEILKSAMKGREGIEKVVCLGLGSLQGCWAQSRNGSHAQLAALMTLVDSLAVDGKSPKLIAQDPVFGPTDKKYLESLGFEIVENPKAFELIDEHSLVYAIHCYWNIYDEVSKGPRPAVLVGNDLEEVGQHDLTNKIPEEPSQRLQTMAKAYQKVKTGAPKNSKMFKDFDWKSTWLYYHADAKETVKSTPTITEENTS